MEFLRGFKKIFSSEDDRLGLDIGTWAVKAVKLRLAKEGMLFCGFSIEPTAAGLESALKKALHTLSTGKINIAVSGLQAITRYIVFPKMKEEELKQALRFEAQKHIPFSIQEVNLDSVILKDDYSENKMLVLLAAAKKDFLALRLKQLNNLGLDVNAVDVDSVALLNAFIFNQYAQEGAGSKALALLNIGATFSNLSILESGIPRLSRDIHTAGNNLTQKISDAFNIETAAAEGLKHAPGSDKEKVNKVMAVTESMASHLAAELRTSFDYYESQSASSVTKIFLSGGGSLAKPLKDMLANLLGIEVEYWDPFRKIKLQKNTEAQALKAASAQLAVAVGLALHS